MFITICLFLAALLCLAISVPFVIGFFNGFRQGATAGTILIRGLVALIFIAGLITCSVFGVKAAQAAKQDNSAENAEFVEDYSNAAPADTEQSQDSAEPEEEFEPGQFTIDFDAGELDSWLVENFGSGTTVASIRQGYTQTTWPTHRTERIAAVKRLMRLYIDKNSEGFQDPVSFPFEVVLGQVFGDGKADWANMSIEDKEAYMMENVKKPVYHLILTDVAYCDMWLQWVQELDAAHNGTFLKDNADWLPQFIEEVNTAYATIDKEPKGITHFFYCEETTAEKPWLTKEYVLNAARVCQLLECFDWANPPVQSVVAETNWRMGYGVSNNFARTQISHESESLPAAVLTANYKSGNPAIRAGVNLYDARAEIIEAKVKTPAPSTTTTTTTTQPKDYQLTIYYKYRADGSKAADTYTATLKQGADYSVTSPVIKGYTADRPVVSGKMPAQNVSVTVWYTKDGGQQPTYQLTIYYKYKADGSKAAETYTAKLKAGQQYNVTSPTISGYTADKTVVSGKMPAQNVEVTVWYVKNEEKVYTLTVKYVYEGGGQAAPDHTEDHKAGEAYSVTSPTISGYTPDRAVVSGKMPAKNHTETVTYKKNQVVEPEYTLTIEYKYRASGTTAAPTYSARLKSGQSYSVGSPSISGYTPDQSVVSGTMPAQNVSVTVWYTKDKVPDDSSGNDDKTPGGDLNPGDGSGEYQPGEPPVEDVPGQGSGDNHSGNNDTGYGGTNTNGNAADRQESSKGGNNQESVSATDPNTQTTGTGGAADPTVTDPNGGTTHGGTAPDNDKIPTHNDTQAQPGNGGGSQSTTGTENSNQVSEPDMED